VWTLSRLRAGARLTATELARQFEISVRTAYRDLDFLRDEWRVPLEFDRERGSFRLTEPTALVTPITLSRGEVVAVFFAERVLREYRGTPFEADLSSAFRKIQELLPEEVSVSPETLEAALSLDVGPVHTPDWYVAAFDERRQAVRDFAMHRIRRITLTTAGYEISTDFSFTRYAADAFGIEKGGRPVEVAIRFSPPQSRWIRERRWHPTARVQQQLDGGCVLRLRVAGLGEVRRWVLQFGACAEVLSPARLRAEVQSELASALRRYSRQPLTRSVRGGVASCRAHVESRGRS
jgi:predicted DNA-binding transcriptional regulator YafY